MDATNVSSLKGLRSYLCEGITSPAAMVLPGAGQVFHPGALVRRAKYALFVGEPEGRCLLEAQKKATPECHRGH